MAIWGKAIILFQVCAVLITQAQSTSAVSGLEQSVEVYRDPYGINHIYANNEHDLFFAQGYCAAKDRLFQFEVWRRQATGTVAEMLGPRELQRDVGTRLFQFRGDMDAEMNYYHPRGKLIIESYVEGVNAYIEEVLQDTSLLPLEFKLLDILPQAWTPEVVISRHQGLLGNIGLELDISRLVVLLGPERVREISWFHPKDPILDLDPRIDTASLFEDVLAVYDAYRQPVRFRPEDIVATAREEAERFRYLAAEWERSYGDWRESELFDIGSNNWVVDGSRTQSGYPIMANDPHRTLAVPSLRYLVHLVAPGWNVIGGGEPEIPGISIGHNEFGAWGLTVFRTDAEDLYFYELNPDNPNEYRYQGAWEEMELVEDRIPVKGQPDYTVTHRYSRHGPVVYRDTIRHVAYAVRCGWLEIGGSPYLASLRMDQATNWDEFKEACRYSHIPGENMVWADRKGDIGWQAVGIAPVRRDFSGLVAVPGDGSYEWDGYLPIDQKPSLHNPASGMIITANENVTPPEYGRWDAIGYSWADPYRGDRLAELLDNGQKHSMADMMRYQVDYLSIPARQLVPLLRHIEPIDAQSTRARDSLLRWDFRMEATSIAAAIFAEWQAGLRSRFEKEEVPARARPYFSPQLKKVIDWLLFPGAGFGAQPMQARDRILAEELAGACERLQGRLGNFEKWQYGQVANKHVEMEHPLARAVNDRTRRQLNVGPHPRGGYGYTVGSTSNSLNQRSGASFRIIVDTESWDHAVGMNAPGQSGDPASPFYANLFELWATDRFFPLFFRKETVESVAVEAWQLKGEE